LVSEETAVNWRRIYNEALIVGIGLNGCLNSAWRNREEEER